MSAQHTTNYIKIEIEETARDNLNASSYRCGDTITELFKDMEGIKEYLTERYGRVPNGRKKIYIDTPDGTQEVGFLYSYWNKDWSHNSKSWFQTDWISITDVSEKPRLIRSG